MAPDEDASLAQLNFRVTALELALTKMELGLGKFGDRVDAGFQRLDHSIGTLGFVRVDLYDERQRGIDARLKAAEDKVTAAGVQADKATKIAWNATAIIGVSIVGATITAIVTALH